MANPEHLAKIREGVEAWNEWKEERFEVRPDLSEANLQGARLQGANLRETNLQGVNFTEANLTEANLTETNLEGTNFQGANLKRTTLREVCLAGNNLHGANLTGAYLVKANLREANFERANLTRTKLMNGYFRGTSFKEAILQGANFAESDSLTVEQLLKAKTLHEIELDPELMERAKNLCPHLFKKSNKKSLAVENNPEQDFIATLDAGYSLPSLSGVAMNLVAMASEEDCSLQAMANSIEKDPALVVRLLRLANTVLLRSRFPASSVKRAIIQVGIKRLRMMVLSISLKDAFPMGTVGPMDYAKFWRSSLYRALLAKSLTECLNQGDSDLAFISGLVQEVGLLILFDLYIKGRDEDVCLDFSHPDFLLAWEKKRYGVDHRRLGAWALRHWGFPEPIIACQNPVLEDAGTKAQASLPEICVVASEFSSLICSESTRLDESFRMAEKRMGLDTNVICEMLMRTFDQVQEAAKGFEVEVDKKHDLVELLEKANRTMIRLSGKAGE